MAGNAFSKYSLTRILQSEATPGLILILCAAIALTLANSPWADAWHAVVHDSWAWTPVAALTSLHAWINDGLMAVFFFAVGLEIKREILDGALADAQQRRLPVVAALAGMAAPAHRGWAIPAATDIAFAVGVLALLGKRVPRSLRLFLLTVAIVDDLGAVAVIALFYTAHVDLGWLSAAAAILALMIACNRIGVRSIGVYVALGVILWVAMLHSGIHATVAGVLAAATVPLALDKRTHSPLLRLEHALVPLNAFVIVPLFALANAGVAIGGSNGLAAALAPLPVGIATGLFVGKQAGVLGAILACERLGIAPRPKGTTLVQVWGIALLCGIGFTMSLFLAQLAFPAAPALVEDAKLGILAGSLLSALVGAIVLRVGGAAKQ